MASMTLSRCTFRRPCIVPRAAICSSQCQVIRPASLQSQLTPSCTSLRSVTSSFAGCTINTAQRGPGSRKRRTRTSGFRARRLTVGGRKVIQNRRKKGRHTLCPANNANKK
ncbi:hypothetical protein WJX77_007205 [Trebouxia sp. C0004]